MIEICTKASYMPGENTLTYKSSNIRYLENVTASYCYCFIGNKIVLANNRKRGLEIPGGHVEKNELPCIAAVRENEEETGVVVGDVKKFLHATHTCLFPKPENYKYPYPISYMEFFTSMDVKNILKFEETDECKKPEFVEFVTTSDCLTLLPSNKQMDMVVEFLEKNIYFNIFAKEAYDTCKNG